MAVRHLNDDLVDTGVEERGHLATDLLVAAHERWHLRRQPASGAVRVSGLPGLSLAGSHDQHALVRDGDVAPVAAHRRAVPLQHLQLVGEVRQVVPGQVRQVAHVRGGAPALATRAGMGGLRGAVATALALSLLGRGPGCDQVRALTYGVVLSSILLQGVTIGSVARRLLGHDLSERATS